MYLKDRTENGGELLLYVNETLLGKIINSYKFKENSEIILFEFSASNKKWLLLSNHKPPFQNYLSFINELNLTLNFFSPVYENFVLIGNFSMSTANPNLKNLICSFDFDSLIDSLTFSVNCACINLDLTNKKNLFMKYATFERGLSIHRKLTKNLLRKLQVKVVQKLFPQRLQEFDQKKIETELKPKINLMVNLNYSTSRSVFLEILNKIAPIKAKILSFKKQFLYD